jgi:hypothetical protein
MSLRIVRLFIPLLFSACAAAQDVQTAGRQGDQNAYCAYLDEQARAQGAQLRTPTALAGFTQPETGQAPQLVAGAQLSLSNVKKAAITLDAARKNCALYRASTGVALPLQYASAALEKDALTHRLELIDEASRQLGTLISETNTMVEAQNMTRPMLLALVSNRIKLEADRAETQARIAALYVPQLPAQPLKQLVAAKQRTDIEEQKALAHLTRQNNWDVQLTVGVHQQLNPVANGSDPYGLVSFNYNLGARAVDRHLDRSVVAYGEWKKTQEGDAERSMEVLKDQLLQSIQVQKDRQNSLLREAREIEKSMDLVRDPQTSSALDFRNQLQATKLLLEIESGDAAYRLAHLQSYLESNF